MRRRPEAHRRGQPLHSEARSAKNDPECAICWVLRRRSTTTGSVARLVPISFPRSAPRRAGRTKLRTPCAILKGLGNPAQGRPVLGQRGDGPTLGSRPKSSPTLKAVASCRPTLARMWPNLPDHRPCATSFQTATGASSRDLVHVLGSRASAWASGKRSFIPS